MGTSYAAGDDIRARSTTRAASGDRYAYSAKMSTSSWSDRKVHETLDVRKANTLGEHVRECLDSPEHPNTVGTAVIFDCTGSMGHAAHDIADKLGTLKGATLRAGLDDLQLLFGCYGDAQAGDRAPLQIGQFESGLEMEEWLNNIYIEGGGGGNFGEGSGLALYYLGHHSRLDSLDKRGKKGYIILSGDERPLPRVTRDEIKTHVGDDVQGDLSIDEVVAKAQESYEIYMFLVDNATAKQQESLKEWSRLLGADHVIVVQSLDTFSEQVAMLLAALEGAVDDIDSAVDLLVAEGADATAVNKAAKAVEAYVGRATIATVPAEGDVPVPVDDTAATRL